MNEDDAGFTLIIHENAPFSCLDFLLLHSRRLYLHAEEWVETAIRRYSMFIEPVLRANRRLGWHRQSLASD
jgi:hypothetical protein